jgi:hypothetical protein
LSFHLDSSTDNTYQGDYTTFDIEFTMHQDTDTSSGDTGPEEESEPQLPLNVDLTEVMQWNLVGRGSMVVTNQLDGFSPMSGTMAFIVNGPTGTGPGIVGDPVLIPPFVSPFVPPFAPPPPIAVEGSALYTTMVVPDGATRISLMYNFLRAGPMQSNADYFTLVIVRENTAMGVVQRNSNTFNNFVPSTSGFNWQTNWVSSGYIPVLPGETIEIYLTIVDGFTPIYDSGVLIDNVMFS